MWADAAPVISVSETSEESMMGLQRKSSMYLITQSELNLCVPTSLYWVLFPWGMCPKTLHGCLEPRVVTQMEYLLYCKPCNFCSIRFNSKVSTDFIYLHNFTNRFVLTADLSNPSIQFPFYYLLSQNVLLSHLRWTLSSFFLAYVNHCSSVPRSLLSEIRAEQKCGFPTAELTTRTAPVCWVGQPPGEGT